MLDISDRKKYPGREGREWSKMGLSVGRVGAIGPTPKNKPARNREKFMRINRISKQIVRNEWRADYSNIRQNV
jgi:hypothetical protein